MRADRKRRTEASKAPVAWQRAFDGIFDRGYYANHGPLVQALEQRIEAACSVGGATVQAKVTTNGMVAMMSALAVLELRGQVIVPPFAHPSAIEALRWYDLRPVTCGVDAQGAMTVEHVAAVLDPATCAVIAAGDGIMWESWRALAATQDLALIADRSGAPLDGQALAAADAVVVDFERSPWSNVAGGGCVLTRSAARADLLGKTRSFKPGATPALPSRRMNAKMSEAQAALALQALERALDG